MPRLLILGGKWNYFDQGREWLFLEILVFLNDGVVAHWLGEFYA